jgi:Holliday junction resolvase RusA-like endonuclease
MKQTYLYIESPRHITLPRKTKKDRKIALNMNSYGNTNTFINNEVKKTYLEVIREQIEGIEIQTPVQVTYCVVQGSRRCLDKMNVVAVVSKYLFDALTELGVWGDDCDEFVKRETILPTMYIKGKNLVQIWIKSVT